jgi:hypothetical protein
MTIILRNGDASNQLNITGPEHYELNFTADNCTVKFSGLAKNNLPKLYAVVVDGKIIYVGVTKRNMRSRFYTGWKAKGKGGYYGYAWRHTHKTADLYVWCHENAVDRSSKELETVEAEVAYLVRKAGQWPASQTEIHFHPSKEEHRKWAVDIVSHVNSVAAKA